VDVNEDGLGDVNADGRMEGKRRRTFPPAARANERACNAGVQTSEGMGATLEGSPHAW